MPTKQQTRDRLLQPAKRRVRVRPSKTALLHRDGPGGKFAPSAATCKAMLQVARTTASVGQVAESVGISYSTLVSYCERTPAFARALDDTLKSAIDEAEAELYRRAMQARDECFYDVNKKKIDVFDSSGRRVTPVSVANNDLLKFFLRHRKPSVYNSPANNISVAVNVGTLTPERIKAMSEDELLKIISLPDSDFHQVEE